MAARSRIAVLGVLAGLVFTMASMAITGVISPATAGHRTMQLAECSEPKCLSGTRPAWRTLL